jgi:hypothetical protein
MTHKQSLSQHASVSNCENEMEMLIQTLLMTHEQSTLSLAVDVAPAPVGDGPRLSTPPSPPRRCSAQMNRW